MGLFSRNASEDVILCKLCDKKAVTDMTDYGICNGCALVLDVDVKTLKEQTETLSAKANAATDSGEKIIYLKALLDMLYQYKIKYYDNGVDVLGQDIEEMIDEVIDCISEAKL